MPRLTAAQLQMCVEAATQRDCTADGRELRSSTTDWQAAAEALSNDSGYVVTADQVESAVDSGIEQHEGFGPHIAWKYAAECLCDRLDEAREPDAAPEGDE